MLSSAKCIDLFARLYRILDTLLYVFENATGIQIVTGNDVMTLPCLHASI